MTDEEMDRGLNNLLWAGIHAQLMVVFTSGAFLVAFFLALGASNFVIGLVAAAAPFCQILQIPAIALVQRLRWRKALTVLAGFPARIVWVFIALVPFLMPERWWIPTALGGLVFYYAVGAVANCAWNSWVRDLVPQNRMGDYFGRRMAIMTAVGAAGTLLAGWLLDVYEGRHPGSVAGYAGLFVVATIIGIYGLRSLSLTPELTKSDQPEPRFREALIEPFRNVNFRNLLKFLAIWNFAINLAAPFFVVYMLQRLSIPMSFIIALSVVSQGVNVVFFRIWGRLADLFSNKSVLSVSGALFLVSIALFPFTTLPEKHALTLPLLGLIHILAGISTAGVALCGANIALELSPEGRSTSYLAVNGLVSGLAATFAPVLAGLAADSLNLVHLTFNLNFGVEGMPDRAVNALDLRGLDFLFVLAVFIGFYGLHRLLAVREEGEVHEKVVIQHLYGQARNVMRSASNIGGMRYFTYFPAWALVNRQKREERKSLRRSRREAKRRAAEQRLEAQMHAQWNVEETPPEEAAPLTRWSLEPYAEAEPAPSDSEPDQAPNLKDENREREGDGGGEGGRE